MSKTANDEAHQSPESTEVLSADRLVDGKYRLGRLLGEGGMGAVYEAEHTGLGTRVALKMLNESYANDPKAVSRFRREARAAAVICHENIVAVHDTGTTEQGVPFLIMELLDGESLSSFLRREHIVAPKVAAAVACQVLSGLAAAHAKKVVHRDLKPGNVLLARQPDGTRVVKVLDFGISKFFSESSVTDVTATGAVVGTPRFMAPEQARGQADLDARVDLYAVGVLLYRMVTGKMPIAGTTQQEIIATILAGSPTPPRDLEPTVPPALQRVILRALEVHREQRYQTAEEFIAELQEAMPEATAGEPIQIPVSGEPEQVEAGPLSRSSSIPSLVGVDVRAPTRQESPQARIKAQRHAKRRAVILRGVIAGIVIAVAGLTLWALTRPTAPGDELQRKTIAGTAYPGPPLRMGITRYLPIERLVEEHAPLIRYLARKLQRPVELIVLDNYIDLADKLTANELQIAALAAYEYVRATASEKGIKLLATHETSAGRSYEGFIIARANSGIRQLTDLRNKIFCYVGRRSSSGYLYPRALFRKAGMNPDTAFKATRLCADHLGALKALHERACDGAAVFAGMLFGEAKQHGIPPEQFTILERTDRIPHVAYCVAESLPADLTHQLRQTMLELKPGSRQARSVLGESARIRGFAPAQNSDYDPVRRIAEHMDHEVPTD